MNNWNEILFRSDLTFVASEFEDSFFFLQLEVMSG